MSGRCQHATDFQATARSSPVSAIPPHRTLFTGAGGRASKDRSSEQGQCAALPNSGRLTILTLTCWVCPKPTHKIPPLIPRRQPAARLSPSNCLFQSPVFSNRLDLHWHSPESDGVWYKSTKSKKTICSTEQFGSTPYSLHPTPHPTPYTLHP